MRYHIASVLPIILGVSLINSIGTSLEWLAVVFGIGMLIFVHELGHFLVARYEKVRVEQFALGFGSAILKKKVGDTEYRINMIPLGGYVKMAGEEPNSPKSGAADEFSSKTPGSRMRIVIAGVTMNFIFGLLFLIIAFHIGIQFPAPIIGNVYVGGPAWNAGLQRNDEIIEIDGRKIHRFQDIMANIAFGSRDRVTQITFKRGSVIQTCNIQPEYNEELGILQIGIEQAFESLKIPDESELYRLGLRTGDRLVEMNGHPIQNSNDIYSIIPSFRNEEKITLVVERGQEKHSFSMQRKGVKSVYRIGITPRQLTISAIRKGSHAEKAGLRKNDRIVMARGIPIYSHAELSQAHSSEGNPLVITVERASSLQEISLPTEVTSEKFWEDVAFSIELYLAEVSANMPASKYLIKGDKIVSIQGKTIQSWSEISEAIVSSQGKAISIAISRNNALHTFEIEPLEQKDSEWPLMGLTPKLSEIKSNNIIQSCQYGIDDTTKMIKDIFVTLRGIFSQNISAKNLGGPILIFKASHHQLKEGFGYFLYFLALISINLAVINLFPIPVLDGGFVLFLTIEKIRGKPFSERFLFHANMIGISLLLSLIVFVTFHDILRLL